MKKLIVIIVIALLAMLGATTTQAATPFTLWAVGDLCDDDNAAVDCDDVGTLVNNANPAYFVPLGDNQYENGSLSLYNQYYHPKVGSKLNDVTKPVAGNHEYRTTGASGYYAYFGSKAGDPNKGYYSWTLGNWKMIVLNSNCGAVAGGCGYTGAQAKWLDTQLQGPETCEILFDHHPPYTDGKYSPGIANTRPFFKHAYENKAELFLSGHDHGYQRFSPRNAAFVPVAGGVRALVVGTGGKSFYGFTGTNRSEYRQGNNFGALRLTLSDTGYTGAFVNVNGVTMDNFSGSCT